MKAEAQRIAIAEACGWKYWHDDHETMLLRPDEKWPALPHWKERGMRIGDGRPAVPLTDISGLPDYLNDLNAMHEAEKTLGSFEMPMDAGSLPARYWDILCECSTCYVHATAAQRAEAFLRTIGKWTDETISGVSTPTTEGVTK